MILQQVQYFAPLHVIVGSGYGVVACYLVYLRPSALQFGYKNLARFGGTR